MKSDAVGRRWDSYQIPPSFVLGFHGCQKSVGEAVLRGDIPHLLKSEKSYDWLGTGIYFWEGNPQRAWEWALERKGSWDAQDEPFVLGAIINLGRCLDLRDSSSLQEVRSAYDSFRLFTPTERMPENGGKDGKSRRLDCAVINYLHSRREDENLSPYNTVRADFWEGDALYPDAGFREQDHIQICVCDTVSILGYFRPIEQA